MSIFLVVTAMFFYMPRAIWLMVEGGLMKFLAKGTTTKIVEKADEKRENLIKTFAVSAMTFILSITYCVFFNFFNIRSTCTTSTIDTPLASSCASR